MGCVSSCTALQRPPRKGKDAQGHGGKGVGKKERHYDHRHSGKDNEERTDGKQPNDVSRPHRVANAKPCRQGRESSTLDPDAFQLHIDNIRGIPVASESRERAKLGKDGWYVRVSIISDEPGEQRFACTNVVRDFAGNPHVNSTIGLPEAREDDVLRLGLYASYFSNSSQREIGRTFVSIRDLAQMGPCELMLFDKYAIAIFDSKQETPCLVSVSVANLPSGWSIKQGNDSSPSKIAEEKNGNENSPSSTDVEPHGEGTDQNENDTAAEERKRVFVVTRGTRGDVQPFLALARGLAETKGWEVIICTELRYKELIKKFSHVQRGKIRFRPSGGDTEKRIDTKLCKWAINSRNEYLQVAIVAHTEREFFASEPAFFYWAKRTKPDYIVFGFCMANVAMIISEALRIPMIGFILQPTVIPSASYPAVIPLGTEDLSALDTLKGLDMAGHRVHRHMKKLMENNPFTMRLNGMRIRRGLEPFKGTENDYQIIVKENLPYIVPIHPIVFGGKPNDWGSNSRMTDFIFLRSKHAKADQELSQSLREFIEEARKAGRRLVVVTFSSMPIPKSTIVKVALTMLRSPENISLIALIGSRPESEHAVPKDEIAAMEFVKNKRLYVGVGAPFGALFPEMDFIIMHGGLGTTAETLRAGKPCMVTGVLLMDQRFWGRRVHELGVGPPPCHISELKGVILDVLGKAFEKGQGSWAENARELAKVIQPKTEDGVAENVETFTELTKIAKVHTIRH